MATAEAFCHNSGVVVSLLLGSDGARSDVTFGLSTLAELTASLHVLTEATHHERDRAWAERIRAALPGPLLRELGSLSALWGSYRARFLLPISAGLDLPIDQELGQIAAMPIDQFAVLAAYALRGGDSGQVLDDVLDRIDLQSQVIERARLRGRDATALARRLFEAPDAFRARVLEFLHDGHAAFFVDVWERTSTELAMDARRRRDCVSRIGLPATLAQLSPSMGLREQPARVHIDKIHHGVVDLSRRPLLVVPSALGWPHLLVKHEPGWPVVLQYPVKFAGRGPISLDLLHKRLVVLADPVRLKLCRAVAREARTTSELATIWGMSESQISRHLRGLRDAGLVRTSRRGRFVVYELEAGALARLGEDLRDALLR